MSATAPNCHRHRPDHRSHRTVQGAVAGRTYLLSVATLYGRPVFRDDEAARAVCRVHAAAWLWRDAQRLAWVLMPGQWQGLVTLGERDSLASLMGRFKTLTSRAVGDHHLVNGWLWARGFGDRALAPGESAMHAARSLVQQPVRAGLVARAADYAYWDAVWLLAGEPG